MQGKDSFFKQFFGLGRLNRIRFIAFTNLVLLSTVYVAMELSQFQILTLSLLAVGVALATKMSAQRYKDVGVNGWWALVLLIPFASPFLLLILAVIPGDSSSNQFGEPNSKASVGLILLAIVPLIFLAALYATYIGLWWYLQ